MEVEIGRWEVLLRAVGVQALRRRVSFSLRVGLERSRWVCERVYWDFHRDSCVTVVGYR
jgi:hypothetical protein